MTAYADYLKANGATDEDVKALTEGSFSGAAKRAFDALQAKLAAAESATAAEAAARVKAEEGATALQEWYNTKAAPEYTQMQNEVVRARAEEARARAVVKTAQERGLIDVATLAGYEPDPAKVVATAAAAPGFDASKYLSAADIYKVAEQERAFVAAVADIRDEHSRLFPDRPLNMSKLSADALAAKQPIQQFWESTYGVVAARDKRAAEEKTAYEARLRKEGADAKAQELIDAGYNPALRVPAPSTNIFAPRKGADGNATQPWDVNENTARNDRVKRAMETEMKAAVTH